VRNRGRNPLSIFGYENIDKSADFLMEWRLKGGVGPKCEEPTEMTTRKYELEVDTVKA